MIEVEPMLDELSIGHEGRLAWVNNCQSPEELYSLISRTLGQQGHEIATLPKLHQLALVSKYDPKEYARRHSMLAVRRVAAKCGLDMPHDAANSYAFSKRLGMLPQRSGAYCCIKCVEEDLNNTNHAFSWYRRKHHLVGVDWCSIHSCALSRIDSLVPFTKLPHIPFSLADVAGKPAPLKSVRIQSQLACRLVKHKSSPNQPLDSLDG